MPCMAEVDLELPSGRLLVTVDCQLPDGHAGEHRAAVVFREQGSGDATAGIHLNWPNRLALW